MDSFCSPLHVSSCDLKSFLDKIPNHRWNLHKLMTMKLPITDGWFLAHVWNSLPSFFVFQVTLWGKGSQCNVSLLSKSIAYLVLYKKSLGEELSMGKTNNSSRHAAKPPFFRQCPSCHLEFGSRSLRIHLSRCKENKVTNYSNLIIENNRTVGCKQLFVRRAW